MTEPITWRSIGAPNFGNTANSMATANDMFRNAFDGIKGVIKEQEATDASNWNLGKEANTNAFLNKLMSYKTAEEAQAAQASGELGNMMSGFGAQIEGNAARTAQQSLVENLQRKEVQAQQHKEFSENVKQQDVVAGLQGALINAANPDEAKRVQQAIGIYRDSGMLNAPGSVKLLNEALTRANTIDDREWLGKERGFKTDDNAREAAKHPLELDSLRANTDLARANAHKARNPETGNGGIGNLAALLPLVKVLHEESKAGPTKEKGKSQFNGDLAIDPKSRAETKKLLDDTGISTRNMLTTKNSFLDSVLSGAAEKGHISKDFKKIFVGSGEHKKPLPLTQSMILEAINADNGVLSPSVESVIKRLATSASSPEYIDDASKYLSNTQVIDEADNGFKSLTSNMLGTALTNAANKMNRTTGVNIIKPERNNNPFWPASK